MPDICPIFLNPYKIFIFAISLKSTVVVLRDSVREILAQSTIRNKGLHVNHIARHIINQNRNLFSDEQEFSYETIKSRINQMLLYDTRRKNGEFTRVKNTKTNKYRKGVYRLKTIRRKRS